MRIAIGAVCGDVLHVPPAMPVNAALWVASVCIIVHVQPAVFLVFQAEIQ